MSEQIVDLIEAVYPGPRGMTGPQGPQGLPGVDAVPADEAVAGYVAGPESSTRAALDVVVARHGDGMHAVFLGDSITYGFRLDESVRLEKRYPALVCSTLGMIEHNYSVRGAGYTKSYADGPRTIGQQVDRSLPVGAFHMPCAATWNRDGTVILDVPANVPGCYLMPGRHYEYKVNGVIDIDLNI